MMFKETFTAETFLKQMEEGWKYLKYAKHYYWTDASGDRTADRYNTSCACALGAAAFASGTTHPLHYVAQFPYSLLEAITSANDGVNENEEDPKAKAIEAVKKAVSLWKSEYAGSRIHRGMTR